MKLKNTNILLAILTSKKNTKMCDQTQNFNLSIKLVDKNHIIYNKKATNTQDLFNLKKEKKNQLQGCRQGREEKGRIQQIIVKYVIKIMKHQKILCVDIVGILGCEEDDMNKKKKVVQVKLNFFFLIRKKIT